MTVTRDCARKRKKRETGLPSLREEQKKIAADAEKAYKEMLQDVKKKKGSSPSSETWSPLEENEIPRINLNLTPKWPVTFPYAGGPLQWPSASQTGHIPFRDRYHPVTGRYRMHAGIDIGGSSDTPIYAAASGVVVESRPSAGYGWITVIYHGDKERNTPVYLECP